MSTIWLSHDVSQMQKAGLTDISTIVVGNKADLEDLRIVPKETAEQVFEGVYCVGIYCCFNSLPFRNARHKALRQVCTLDIMYARLFTC